MSVTGIDLTIKQVINSGVLPKSIPSECLCGADLIINDSLTKVVCSNKYCPCRNTNKLLKAITLLGIKADIGEARALELIVNYMQLYKTPIKHHIQLLDSKIYNNAYMRSLGIHIEKLRLGLELVQEKELEFSDIIHLLQLDKIGKTYSELIFGQFSNLDDMLNYLTIVKEDDSSNYLKMAKHVSNAIQVDITSNTVREITITILENLKLIKYASSVIFKTKNNKKLNIPCIYIAITGGIKNAKKEGGQPFSNRDEFAPYLTDKYGVPVKCIGISKKNTQYLITDGGMENSSKSLKAMKDGIIVVTSDEFVNIVKNIANDSNKGKNLNWGNTLGDANNE